MTRDEMKAFVKNVRSKLRVTKVVATRSVKGKMGDTYVGFSAAWDSVQEDGGHGLVSTLGEGDEAHSISGMTLQEATVAACIVGREADLAAHNHALAGGNISPNYHQQAIAGIKTNYSKLILAALDGVEPNDKPESAK